VRHRSALRWGVVLIAMTAPAVWLAPGCGARTDIDEDAEEEEEQDAGGDAAGDAAADADGGEDASPDAPTDAPQDVAEDAPPDVLEDALPDSPPDAPEDAPEDVSEDVPADVPEDVPADVPEDVPPDGACPDNDGDGYTVCDGDCDDSNPLINPGAFDFPNGLDDDCDGGVDNPILNCSDGLQYTSQDPVDYAKSIDICQATTAGATGANKKWGLISAELRLADGTGTPAPTSHAIITAMGDVIGPRKNSNFVLFSSGLAAAPGQPYYQFGTPQGGTGHGLSSATPPGFPTNKAGCPTPFAALAFDPVNLKLSIRTPTNAKSFGFDHAFFSSEYPEYACSSFNDLWVTLLQTGAPGIANNKNIIFDTQGTPGSVNLNFFDRCVAGPTGCVGTPGFNFCSGGKAELAGTGYGDPDAPCGVQSSIGGATGWVTTEAPVLPGEVITVQFMVWDSSDGIFDSAAILDNFRWLQGGLPNPKTYRP